MNKGYITSPVVHPKFNMLTYCFIVVSKQHQARLADNAGSAGSRDLQGLTGGYGAIIHQRGAIESHFLQK